MQVRDPASRSWSPARLSGAHGPAGARSAAVRKDLSLNLSAVHENIRGRASRRFRNWFRVQASGSIGPICFSWGTASPHPFIVRDESSRVFLGGCSPAVASASPTSNHGGAVFGRGQQERRAKPPARVFAVVKTGRNAGVL